METFFPNSDESDSRLVRERVMEDLRALANDADALLKATAGDVSDKAKEAREKLAVGLEKAKSTYVDLRAQGIESAKAAAAKADTAIRTHPYESIGVGLLLGALLRRK